MAGKRPYIPQDKYEHMEHHEHSEHVSHELAKLRARQAELVRRNLYNFAQLEKADFPGTTPVDIIYGLNYRTLGRIAKWMGKSMVKGAMATRVVTWKTEDGYFVPRPGGCFAVTTDGTVYHEANKKAERGAIEVHRWPRRGMSFQRFENPGTPVSSFKGEDKYPTPRPTAGEHLIEETKVKGTENFASSFERVTKAVLAEAGISYVPFDEAESAPSITARTNNGNHDGITEEMPTLRMPELADDGVPTLELPRTDAHPLHEGLGLVNPADHMVPSR